MKSSTEGRRGKATILDNELTLQHNGRVRSALSLTLFLCLSVAAATAQAEDAEALLGDGWRLYSEELEFERAAEVFEQAASADGASEGQILEALEYLAACSFALGDPEGARNALRRLLEIDSTQNLHDPSHPPDLLALLEEVRGEVGVGEDPPLPDYSPPDDGAGDDPEEPGGGGGLGHQAGDGDDPAPPFQDDFTEDPQPPWYRTWWFWTTIGVVVAVGVTTAIAVSVTSEEAAPPVGNLDPGVVQLPCTGIRF